VDRLQHIAIQSPLDPGVNVADLFRRRLGKTHGASYKRTSQGRKELFHPYGKTFAETIAEQE